MKALARAVVAAAVLATLSTTAAGGAHASPPQVDHGTVDRQQPSQDRHGRVWRCNSGHGPQFDCQDGGSLLGRLPSPDPAAPAPAATDAGRRAALAQEHYYSTWGYGNTPAPAPAKPSGQPDWLLPGLGVLAAAVALATGLAVLAAKRTRRRLRVGQAA